MNEFKQMLCRGSFPLVVSLPRNDVSLAQAAWENGADVVKVHINLKHHASSTQFGSLFEEKKTLEEMLRIAKGPMGIVLGADCDAAEGALEDAISLGFDFISLYGQHVTPKVAATDKVSRMIAPDYSWADWEIEGLEEEGADILEASIIHPDCYGQRMSMRELIHYRHICHLTSLPVVVPTQCAVHPEEVCALRNCGVSSLMIGAVVTGKKIDGFGEAVAAFRRSIDAMNKKE